MKQKIFLAAVFAAFAFVGLAQVPEAFNYQAVVRDNAGEVLANQNVSFRISILQGSETGTVLYSETHTASTNSFGLVNLKIGDGTLVSGVFSPGGWGAVSHFLKVEIDASGGSSYIHLGTSELLSVPYAFHAMTVQEDKVDDADADPVNEIQTLSLIGYELTIEDGNTVTLPSLWETDGSNVFLENVKVGIGGNPGTSRIQFNVRAEDDIAVKALNNSTTYGALFAENLGSGLAGDFRGSIGIFDGTQGTGKVLTSDNTGRASWQSPVWNKNGVDAYYNDGNIGIGTASPVRPLDLHGNAASIYMGFHTNTSGSDALDGLLVGLGSSDNAGLLWNYENGPLQFATNNARRVEIAENGYVGIGMTDPPSLLSVMGSANTSYLKFFHSTSGTATTDGMLVGLATSNAYVWAHENVPLAFGTSDLRRMTITADGAVGIGTNAPTQLLSVNGTAGKVGGGVWSTFSDRRLKDLRGEYGRGLSEILALQPIVFNYKADNPLNLPSDHVEYGFIAQEVRDVFPEAVSENSSGYLEFNMHPIHVAFINAIKELKAENDHLKDKVRELESRFAEIEKRLGHWSASRFTYKQNQNEISNRNIHNCSDRIGALSTAGGFQQW